MPNDMSRRVFLGATAGAGFLLASRADTAGIEDTSSAHERLLQKIDCTLESAPGQYFEAGAVKVVESPAGRYREAEGSPKSRFGYRFDIEHVGKPHRIVIRYPDDKRRFMCIMDGTTYDLTTGVLTGWAQPLIGAMQEVRQIFWPRWKECSVVFMTWGEGEPAAAASIEIWELDALPALDVPGDPGDGSRREFGIQYEDPCGSATAEGSVSHAEWIDRVVEYARHTGQKLLVHPLAWYHGPLFPSQREPAGALDLAAAPDRSLYLRWTTQPQDWFATLLERFDKEGLEFQGSLTLMRLGSLMEKMNIDLGEIERGADTYNNMIWNGQVQSSTGDWTPLYNVRNFGEIAKLLKDKPYIEPFGGGLPPWIYGERPNPACRMAPMFNPLHPTVQEAILGFVREIGERYGKFKSFKGISFNMYASCMPWFGSIRSGYDDLSVKMFQEETGISVPSGDQPAARFARRYDFLTESCRPAWVAWRCRKIRELFGKIREALAASRGDLRVTITLWNETFVGPVLGGISAASQLYARPATCDLFREAGIDLDLYADAPGLFIDVEQGNPRDRGGHGSNPAGGVNLPVESLTMYRDFDFLDQPSLDAMNRQAKPGVFVFNCWVEAWGKHIWTLPAPDDPNGTKFADMDGQPAEGFLRANSEYPEDGFWWKSQMRITPPFQGGVHFLEPYAHALAELDACRITRGGLFLDKAHSEALRQWAQVYRALPNERFVTIGAKTDPVAVRTLLHGGMRYVYAVNREYYPVSVILDFTAYPGKLGDLAGGETAVSGGSWQGVLGPYALRAFTMPQEIEVAGFSAVPPPEIVQSIADQVQKAFTSMDAVRKKGRLVTGMDEFEQRIRTALAEGRYAWLRRALTGYIVRKCGELSA